MLYLLDSSTLITANNKYYPVDRVPEFWEWLSHLGDNGQVKMPLEIFEEIKDGPKDGAKDLLFAWIQEDANKKALLLKEEVDIALVQKVIDEGYAPDLSDDEIDVIGRDPFLVAYGLAKVAERYVVTAEVSKPKTKRQNRKLPDVCDSFAVKWCDIFVMIRALGFNTGWKKSA
ncbi:MAG: DUF4411 family protein [Steroidobacteraceae bacterium]